MKIKESSFRAILLIGLLVFNSQAFSQSIAGKWWGMLTIRDFELRLAMQVDTEGKGYKAQIHSPDQSPLWFPVDTFDLDFPVLRIIKTDWNLKFEGFVDEQYGKITGTFNQYDYTTSLVFSRDSIPPVESSLLNIQTKYNKTEVYITMRDGVKLFTSYYTPKDSTKTYPMLMVRTPYNSEPAGPEYFSYFLVLYYRYIKENYIMVFQDVRGRYMSEGDFEDIRPFIPDKKSDKDIDEASDTYDAVDWLVKNVPHNNGKVGVFGISYPGFYSTMAILSAHPAIKAVSPQAPVTAWFMGDDDHHNGAFFLLDNFCFDYSNERIFEEPTRQGFPDFKWPVSDNYGFFLDLGTIKNVTAKYFGDSIKIWNDEISHPDYDSFWKDRDPCQYLKDVKPAVMTVGGWFDAEDLYGTLHTYEAIEKQNPSDHPNFLVMGPWSHAQWGFGPAENLGNIYWGQDASKPFQELEVKFFDYYLLGKGAGDFNEATIFVTGENQWKSFKTWPPTNVTEKNLYLQPDGKLAFTAPAATPGYDEYMADPGKPVPYAEKVHTQRTAEYMTDDQRFASKRPDVMVYKTEQLTEDITFAGPLTAQLFVSTTGTDADYVVKLIDVFPEDFEKNPDQKNDVRMGGYQMLVRAEVMRGKYRYSFEKPEAFIPNVIAEVKYDIPDVAHTFKKGHRIMIQVQNSWFPLVDRNPQKFTNIYTCSEADFQKAMQRIYHDKKHPSNVKVNVLK